MEVAFLISSDVWLYQKILKVTVANYTKCYQQSYGDVSIYKAICLSIFLSKLKHPILGSDLKFRGGYKILNYGIAE